MIKECVVCSRVFRGINEKTCSKRCSRIYNNQYRNQYWKDNPDKADINRYRAYKRKMKILKERKNNKDFIIPLEINLKQLNILCDECQEKFYANYKIYITLDKTLKYHCKDIEILSQYCNSLQQYSTLNINCTPWGAPICPKCGLVSRHVYDGIEDYSNYNNATNEDYKELYERLKHVDNPPIIKKIAVYLDNTRTRIDFLSEAIQIRRKVCFINKDKSELTEDEEMICIRAMLSKTKELDNINNWYNKNI